MLVLSRKLGQRVKVGDAWLTVVEVTRGKVRLGIEAPEDVVVSREELLPQDQRYKGDEHDRAEGQAEGPTEG